MKYAIWSLMYVGLVARVLALLLLWRRELLSKYTCLSLYLALSSMRTGWLLYLRHTNQRAYNPFLDATADGMLLLHVAVSAEALWLIASHYPGAKVFFLGGLGFASVVSAAIISSFAIDGRVEGQGRMAGLMVYTATIAVCIGLTMLFFREFKIIQVSSNVRNNGIILYCMFMLDSIGSGIVSQKISIPITGIGMMIIVSADIFAGLGWSLKMHRAGEAIPLPPEPSRLN